MIFEQPDAFGWTTFLARFNGPRNRQETRASFDAVMHRGAVAAASEAAVRFAKA